MTVNQLKNGLERKIKMLNAEKHRDQLLKFIEENHNSLFGLDKNSEPISCAVSRCNNCQFGFKKSKYVEGYSCSAAKIKWLLSEYKEPVKLTELEHGILEYLLKKRQYRFVVRERNGIIYAYKSKPKKEADSWGSLSLNNEFGLFNNLFQFVKWEDSEPTSIEYVLKNCEVVNGES